MPTDKYVLSGRKINNICVFCWGRLGDAFIRTPIIDALSKRFQQASITIVTDPGTARAFNPEACTYTIFPYRRQSSTSPEALLQNIQNITLSS